MWYSNNTNLQRALLKHIHFIYTSNTGSCWRGLMCCVWFVVGKCLMHYILTSLVWRLQLVAVSHLLRIRFFSLFSSNTLCLAFLFYSLQLYYSHDFQQHFTVSCNTFWLKFLVNKILYTMLHPLCLITINK